MTLSELLQIETIEVGFKVKDVCLISKALKEGKESDSKDLLIITEEEEVYILDSFSMSTTYQVNASKMASCVSGSSHVALLDSSGSVWTSGNNNWHMSLSRL